MIRISPFWGFFCLLPISLSLADTHSVEDQAGGATTHHKAAGARAFSWPARNLSRDKRLDFRIGESVFQKFWVSSPSSTTASDGLGPRFNARSCAQCHIRNGRGRIVDTKQGSHSISMILKLSVPGKSQHGAPIPDAAYGHQLQPQALTSLKSEGHVWLHWQEKTHTLAGGEVVTLRKPIVDIRNPSSGSLSKRTRTSLRMAQPLLGLGLLEAIPSSRLKALADPKRQARLGLKGSLNWVWDEQEQRTRIGRFGWKASNPTVRQQNAVALLRDIGLSSTVFPFGEGDCQPSQTDCLALPTGDSEHLDGVEVPDTMMDVLSVFTRHIAVPKKRNVNNQQVKAGQRLFHNIGCASCHTPSHKTGHSDSRALAKQTIWPYTDLLLHDMGAELSDGHTEFLATGRKWRTSPLWGVGLAKKVDASVALLHDGRARSIQEAIVWHGGEAEKAKMAYMALPKPKRQQLLRFIESL